MANIWDELPPEAQKLMKAALELAPVISGFLKGRGLVEHEKNPERHTAPASLRPKQGSRVRIVVDGEIRPTPEFMGDPCAAIVLPDGTEYWISPIAITMDEIGDTWSL